MTDLSKILSKDPSDMTEEEIMKLRDLYITLVATVTDAFKKYVDAMAEDSRVVIDFYNSLPQEVKQDLAKKQIKKES